jgi:hypothetical protein
MRREAEPGTSAASSGQREPPGIPAIWEASFATLTEAQVFQAKLSTDKVTQGAPFTDPRAGAGSSATSAGTTPPGWTSAPKRRGL